MNLQKLLHKYVLNLNFFLFALCFAAWFSWNRYRHINEKPAALTAAHQKINLSSAVLNLRLVKDTNQTLSNYLKANPSPFKVVVLVDGGCSVCLQTLLNWKTLVAEEHLDSKKIIFVGYDANYETLKFVSGKVSAFNSPIIIDPMYTFGKTNKIDPNGHEKTLLTDSHWNVICKGDPFEQTELQKTYLNHIR
jgi:hypothetical protein